MYIVKKKIKGKDYYYLRKSERKGKKVKSINVAYLGKSLSEAKKKMEEIVKKQNKGQVEQSEKSREDKQLKEKQKLAQKELTIDDLASFCKRKGFVFPSSEIYGGFAGFWDFGPLGVDLFNNIKQSWWKFFVDDKENILGIDASIISHPRTWKASGHIASFSDVAVICKKCKKATKIDKSELGKVKCECGGEYENQGEFNLMFKTKVGALEAGESFLRPETAQGMFLNFKQVYESSRIKLPFGIAQIGKCFRNEIAPRDFLFRSREFTIAEFEFFIHPEEKKCELLEKKHLNLEINLLNSETQKQGKEEVKKTTIGKMLQQKKLEEWHGYWLAEQVFWFKELGLDMDKIKVREHTKDELSHYSSATFDLDYSYPFGSKEVAGNANRGQFDLTQHSKESKKNLEIFDEASRKKVLPKVIEPTFGIERVFLAVLTNAYNYDSKRENIVLKLPAELAPVKIAVFPLINDLRMIKLSREVFDMLKKEFSCVYDMGGSIGRRYARQDEIGTPFCVTIDQESLKKKDVTIRNRDDAEQYRIKIKDLKFILAKIISGENISKFGKKVNTRKKK